MVMRLLKLPSNLWRTSKMKRKAHFTKLTITLTYYGVGKTPQSAKQNAINEFANEHYELFTSQDYKEKFVDVKQDQTTINKTYKDFVVADDYEEYDANEFLNEIAKGEFR
jgi:hypothetical protein